MDEDIRWDQRFVNYNKALEKLKEAVEYFKNNMKDKTNVEQEILKEGLIQRFEYTHELAWNTMKDYAEYQGNFNVKGSRDATREAFKMNIVHDGDIWMEMIKSRNDTSHTYNEATANEIYEKIISSYYPAFIAFAKEMEALLPMK